MCYRGAGGTLEVLDGFRRLRAARQYGFPRRLRVELLAVDEDVVAATAGPLADEPF